MTPRVSTPAPRVAALGGTSATRRARGAAYVEAILVVIFMTIIFVGVQYLGSYFDAKQRALGKARECAWAFSKNACVFDDECGQPEHAPCLPEGCEQVLGRDIGRELEEDPNEALATNVERAQGEAQGLDPNEEVPDDRAQRTPQQNLRAGVDEKMSPMMQMLVGEGLNSVGTGQIKVPRMIPDARSQISVTYYLPCNLRHRDPFSVAMDLFGSLFPGGL